MTHESGVVYNNVEIFVCLQVIVTIRNSPANPIVSVVFPTLFLGPETMSWNCFLYVSVLKVDPSMLMLKLLDLGISLFERVSYLF